MELKDWLSSQLSQDIFNKKYRDNEETLEEFFDRVSHGYEPVKKLIREKKFLFGGRILSNRGVKDRKGSLSNCYVITPPEDNIESIFECCTKLARTYSYGGGCGIDISNLRPKGAPVNNQAKTTCGPVGFMELFSQVTNTIGQSGRRGALMISLNVNHPDIEDFINCKTDLNKVNYANISVMMTDDFMKAVENNEDYVLRWPCDEKSLPTLGKGQIQLDESQVPYNKLVTVGKKYIKRVKAKELFLKLIHNNWDYAEPGILYWDTITNYNLLNNTDFKYAGTNPCAEEPLPAGGSCLLGSMNLSEYIINPFTDKAKFDYDNLEKDVFTCIVALNQVLIEGLSLHPLEEQRQSVSKWHQIGLGTMGLADALIKLGIKYGSDESLKMIEEIYKTIAHCSIVQSVELAKELGCFPGCEKEKLLESSFVLNQRVEENFKKEIKKWGMYNSQLLTCAPTGSIGTMFECSTGVEPNFAFSYYRKTQSLHGEDTFYEVESKIVQDYKKATGKKDLPDYFVSSADISPIDRVKVQAVLQKYIDASISSTINLPKEATEEDVYDIYMNAWKNKLKGVTVYRSGCKREGVLTEKPKEIPTTKAPKRPKDLEADFYTVMSKGTQYIVLVGLLEGKPYEIFAFKPNIKLVAKSHKGIITKKSKMHYTFTSDYIQITELELANENVEEKAATLYASMLLRHGVDIKYIIKTTKKVNDNITSFSSAMCRILSKYIPSEELKEKCPECGDTLINEGGCIHCKSCGWSKCS